MSDCSIKQTETFDKLFFLNFKGFEKGTQNSKAFPFLFRSIKWSNDKQIMKYKSVIERINGETGFNIYDGPHPKLTDTHKWRKNNDTRNIK